jgi:hypothetical protein
MIYKALVVFVLSVLFFASSVLCQVFPRSQTNFIINVEGEVVASDTIAPKFHVEGHRRPTRAFLVQVRTLLSGNEPEDFILVIYHPSRKFRFVRAVSDGKYRFEMKLRRSRSCDSSISGLPEYMAGIGQPSDGRMSPLKWLRKDISISPEKWLPCYSLRDEDFRFIRRN